MKTLAYVHLLPVNDSILKQHLYITLPQSNLEISKINAGDKVFDLKSNLILTVKNIDIDRAYVEEYFNVTVSLEILQKIIATTNNDLGILTILPQSFIENFTPEIKQIQIELELNLNGKNAIDRSHFVPKLNENNEICIFNEDWAASLAIKNIPELPYVINSVTELRKYYIDALHLGHAKAKEEKINNSEIFDLVSMFCKDFPLHRGCQIMDSDIKNWINNLFFPAKI